MREKREVVADYLPELNKAVEQLVTRPEIHSLVDTLKKQLQQTSDPFVWSTIDLQSVMVQLPRRIRSCWIFVLKKDVPARLSMTLTVASPVNIGSFRFR